MKHFTTRECNYCHKVKPAEAFAKKGNGYRQRVCRECFPMAYTSQQYHKKGYATKGSLMEIACKFNADPEHQFDPSKTQAFIEHAIFTGGLSI